MDPHPLQIDLVLDKVFAHLEIRHLLICRQVGRKWEEISRSKLIRILERAKSLDFYEAFHPIKNLWHQQYFKMNEYGKKRFCKQNLGNYFCHLETSPRIIPSDMTINFTREKITILSNYLQKFLWEYGNTLHHLTLNWARHLREPSDFPNFFRNLIFNQCKHLKSLILINIPDAYTTKSFTGDGYYQPTNITELRIKCIREEYDPILNPKDVFNFARNIFNSCPKLEKLEWTEFGSDRETLILLLKKSKCIETLKTVRMVEIIHPACCTHGRYSTWSLVGDPGARYQKMREDSDSNSNSF